MLELWLPDTGYAVHPFLVLLVALAIDAAIGDPPALFRIIPHPVAALGNLIGALERHLNDVTRAQNARRRRGIATTLLVVALAAVVGWAATYVTRLFPGGWIVEAVLAGTLIAFRGLYDHANAVAGGLGRSLEDGRDAVRHIVGRDPAALDAAGVARAAIESTAENFSDGVVAPALWFAILGLPGLAAYKAINTADSMIGHRNTRFADFGRFAARLDDAANWAPARIAGVLIVLAAAVTPGAHARAAWRTLRRDAARHRSPNAGWQEAPMAGALGLALAGPRRYGGTVVDDDWLGDGRREAGPADIDRALAVYVRAGVLLAACVAAGIFV